MLKEGGIFWGGGAWDVAGRTGGDGGAGRKGGAEPNERWSAIGADGRVIKAAGGGE